MASVLLVIVAVGFAPSFYLPGILRPEQAAAGGLNLPPYIVLHGIAITLWYLLLLIQSLLIAKRRVRVHRALGMGGAALGAALVPLSLLVVTRSVARSNLGVLPVIGDFGLLALFTILVTLGIHFRSKPKVHKRLMLIASIGLVAPAMARWPGAHAALPLSVIIPQLTMYGAIIVHDIVTGRRVHLATAWGVAAYVVTMGVSVALANTEIGHQLVNSLK
jgi:hypothetical protein